MIRKFHMGNMLILLKLIFRFNKIQNKILEKFVAAEQKAILKFVRKGNEFKITKMNL